MLHLNKDYTKITLQFGDQNTRENVIPEDVVPSVFFFTQTKSLSFYDISLEPFTIGCVV